MDNDERIHNAHDSSYKLLFSHPEMVADLLTGYIKQPWVEKLDLSTLETVSASFISDDLREREDDIIWRVRWRGEADSQWLYIYLLLEFQSSVDRFMPLRLNIYSSLLLDDLRKSKQFTANGKLPPVFPIVLYNGEKKWTAPLELSELIDSIPGGLHLYQPNIRYALLEERTYEDEPLPEVKNLVSALFALENSKAPEDIQRILAALIEWLKQPEQTGLRRNFTVWIKRVLLPARVPGVQFEQVHNLHEVHSMLAERVKTWTEEWKQQGLEEGRKEGRLIGIEQGIEKGIEQGMALGERSAEARTLRRLLVKRFGELPAEIDSRISQASETELDRWLDRILDADGLEDIFV